MNFLIHHSFSLLWIISSLIIALLSFSFKSTGPDYQGGIYYILFSMAYFVFIFFSKKSLNQKSVKLNPYFFILGVIPLIFVTPLFENDHYRYIWEGKVLLSGHNPYIFAPSHPKLDFIDFGPKSSIGFSDLTTIYPPLGLFFFWIVSFFKFDLALKLLITLNAAIVYFWLKLILGCKVRPEFILLCVPYLQKEFIGAVHIDLIASIFILIPIIYLKRRPKLDQAYNYLGYFLSYWTKILGVMSIPFLIIYNKARTKITIKELILLSFVFISLPLFFFFMAPSINQLKGVTNFSQYWVWNPGLYAILELFKSIDEQMRRLICLICFSIYYFIVFFYYYFTNYSDGKYTKFIESHLLIYSGLMFMSPVYNAWYAIWFLPFALIINNRWGVYYAFFTCTSYLPYGHIEYRYYGHFFNHLFFVIMVASFYLKRNTQTTTD